MVGVLETAGVTASGVGIGGVNQGANVEDDEREFETAWGMEIETFFLVQRPG